MELELTPAFPTLIGQLRVPDPEVMNRDLQALILAEELGKIANENFLKDLDRPRMVQRLAYYLAEINAAHPFREGNGRAQREFIRELALVSGHNVKWSTLAREELYEASANSMGGNLSGLIDILDRVNSLNFPAS
jgi:fido (protein-threonine AMPylation protein)